MTKYSTCSRRGIKVSTFTLSGGEVGKSQWEEISLLPFSLSLWFLCISLCLSPLKTYQRNREKYIEKERERENERERERMREIFLSRDHVPILIMTVYVYSHLFPLFFFSFFLFPSLSFAIQFYLVLSLTQDFEREYPLPSHSLTPPSSLSLVLYLFLSHPLSFILSFFHSN